MPMTRNMVPGGPGLWVPRPWRTWEEHRILSDGTRSSHRGVSRGRRDVGKLDTLGSGISVFLIPLN